MPVDGHRQGDRRARQYVLPRRHAGAGRQAIVDYYQIGVESVLIRGFDPFNDTVAFGRELIPRIRRGVAQIDGDT